MQLKVGWKGLNRSYSLIFVCFCAIRLILPMISQYSTLFDMDLSSDKKEIKICYTSSIPQECSHPFSSTKSHP